MEEHKIGRLIPKGELGRKDEVIDLGKPKTYCQSVLDCRLWNNSLQSLVRCPALQSHWGGCHPHVSVGWPHPCGVAASGPTLSHWSGSSFDFCPCAYWGGNGDLDGIWIALDILLTSWKIAHIYRHLVLWEGFPHGSAGKETACQCRRCKKCEFNPWVGKIPWRRKWQPTPVS